MEKESHRIDLTNKLIDKSIEAFIMGLEIYNKPTIKYRIEGFSFFICNAWELILKAKLLKDKNSIYYTKDSTRTISLSECVKKVYSDQNTRIRLNLEKIIDLRNISTHFITEDYEVKYAPLFQACVINYTEELYRFHNRDITTYVPQNFLTIAATLDPLSNEEIKLRYPAEIAEKFIQQANEIDVLTEEYNSDKFSINIKQNLYITKKKDEANFLVKFDKASPTGINIVKELKDPADTHKYSYSNVITAVTERMKKLNLKIDYKNGFNQHVLNLFINFYNVKSNEKYAYKHVIGKNENYTYSQQLVEFIIECIKKDSNNFYKSFKEK